MSLSGPQRQAEERLARPVHCPDPREPRPPLHAWAPRCTCLSVKLSGPEPRAVRARADWRPVSEGAESKPVKATGSWDQLGQQLGAAGTELRAGHRGPGDRRATPVGRAQSWSTRRWPVQGRPPTSCPCGRGRLGVHSSRVLGHRGEAWTPGSPPPGCFQAMLWGDGLRIHNGSEVKVTDFPAPSKSHHTQDESFRTRVKRSAR